MKQKIGFLLLPLSLCACANIHSHNQANTPATTYAVAVQNKPQISVPQPKMEPSFNRPLVAQHRSHKSLVGEAAISAANQKSKRGPKAPEFFNSIMNFNYTPGMLYQIYCAPLSVTDIQFQSGEHIVSVAAGDTMRWQVSKTYSGSGFTKQEHLLVKPTEEDLDNGLVITTDQRTYHLLLHSTPKTYMASVTWRYPNSEGLVNNLGDDIETTATGFEPDMAVDVNRLDMKYHVYLGRKSHKPDWFPLMVFNNGSKTFIKFPSNIEEAPTLFVGTSPKNQRIVNYRVSGNFYIVDSVLTQAQLRSGQDDQYLVQIIHY